MFGNKRNRKTAVRVLASLFILLISVGLMSCSSGSSIRGETPAPGSQAPLAGRIAEVSPPATIQELRQFLEAYQPQVKILSPRAGEVVKDDRVSVRFQVRDLPIYKDEELELGPHLHFILDNEPYQAIYNADEPVVLENLAPGTHTLRAFASRPWHESFKNEGAYAQVTFHVFTKTPDNAPIPNQPLLTYSRPKGSYGAEPIMLDFYLTNAPLHLIAQERADDEILDWRIRCTVNGESFIFDEWQPIYLKGLKPGKNWLQLELLDENGNAIANPFNNTVRLITYEPNGQDPFSKLIRGELPMTTARRIVDPNYIPDIPQSKISEPEVLPSPAPDLAEPEPRPSPIAEPTPAPLPAIAEPEEPEEPEEPAPSIVEPIRESPDVEPPSADAADPPTVLPDREPQQLDSTPDKAIPEVEPTPADMPQPEAEVSPKPRSLNPTGFFNRFRREPPGSPSPVAPPATLPEVIEETDLDDIVDALPEPGESLEIPEELLTPESGESPAMNETDDAASAEASDLQPDRMVEPTPQAIAPSPVPPSQASNRAENFLNRFRRPAEPVRPLIRPESPINVEQAPLPTELTPPESAIPEIVEPPVMSDEIPVEQAPLEN